MGSSSWSDSSYSARATHRVATNTPVFAYSAAVASGAVASQVHETLDPAKMKGGRREARDSTEHPVSNAVAVMFDVTGSMGHVPTVVQQKLPTLMGLLLRKSYLTDPAILIGAIGDANCDRAPLQVGQFESGIEIEDCLTNLWLEGGGGGQKCESYELALYFLARHTSIDCFEKRQKRGYAFVIGDEMPYDKVRALQVKSVFGDNASIEADIPIETIIAEVQERYELFFVFPRGGSYWNDPQVFPRWQELLGERALRIEDSEAVAELIASTIGLCEGSVTAAGLHGDLVSAGTELAVASSVSRSLEKVGAGTAISKPDASTGLEVL